jgi:hypothetical protein
MLALRRNSVQSLMIPARGRDDGGARYLSVVVTLCAACALLSACQSTGIPYAAGTPEYAAALVSRGYDCGLRPDRAGITRPMGRAERSRFVGTGQVLSVRSYNAPRGCSAVERAAVLNELRAAAAR